jgi:hypothetical protein
MNQITTFSFFFLFSLQIVFSQEDKPVHGKIIVKNAMVEGVHIVNLVNEKEAVTNANGEFTIAAKPNDVLVFSAVHLDFMRKIIEDSDYASGYFTVEMTSKINQLDEVEINNTRIDAVALGILSKPAKHYTPAERKLFTAQSGKLDELLNLLSGRTKMLKNDVQTEKKELLLHKLDGMYEDDFYIEKLCIEKEDINGFLFYVVEDKKFAEALNAKNKPLTTFLIVSLAEKYNKLRSYEPK